MGMKPRMNTNKHEW